MQYKGIFTFKTVEKLIKTKIMAGFLAAVLLVSGCSASAGDTPAARPDTEDSDTEDTDISKKLSASDIAVYVSFDPEKKTVRLLNKDNGKLYEVSYDSLTEYYDKYGKVSVIELFNAGDVVDVSVSVHSKTMSKMQQSPSSFIRRNLEKYTINPNRGVFSADGENFRINPDTPVFKGGKKMKLADISEGDELTVSGVDTDIYSIVITSGDGHVSLTGTEYFVGGWVQIGKDIIKPITDEMMIDVPEGEYDMVVTYNGRGGTKHINVERGKELKVDISDLKGELIKYGILVFTILPSGVSATVRIDGEEYDYLQPIELEYGVYRLEVEAKGYIPVKEYLSVGQDMSNVQIELMEAEDETEEEETKPEKKDTLSSENIGGPPSNLQTPVSSNVFPSSSSSAPAENTGGISTTVKGRLYIDAPEGAEVYYDGSYKGVVPCNFPKTTGTHVVTLRQDGYRTKTYTITLDDTIENETYSFSALISE